MLDWYRVLSDSSCMMGCAIEGVWSNCIDSPSARLGSGGRMIVPSESCWNIRLTAITPAVPVRAARSAPTYPGVCLASARKSKSPSSLSLEHCTFKILKKNIHYSGREEVWLVIDTYCIRDSSSGTLILISWSNRPARRKAASRESGLLVAPITITGLLSVLSQDISASQLNDVPN